MACVLANLPVGRTLDVACGTGFLTRFLHAEARRVARELVIVDASLRDGIAPAAWQDRVLNDGSRWQVFKRYFEPDHLVREIGGGEVLLAGTWFVIVRLQH